MILTTWWITLFLFLPSTVLPRPRCGGTLTSARGIIQTPHFPSQFPVPIHCRWVIDAQLFTAPNTSIYVYLTQLYVFEGLTFEEYQIYDDTYQLNGRTLHTVTEANVTRVGYVASRQGYLVITLRLDSIESTHLRVLDHLLDVYGFNITYEISGGEVRGDRCTMVECGFTGYCYDHYIKFSCDCFDGFTGPRCSKGPHSLCVNSRGSPACKNGGICTHVGDSAVRCDCLSGFSGDNCETPITTTLQNDDCVEDDCLSSCSYDGRRKNVCRCADRKNSTTANDVIGYSGSFHITSLPNLREAQLRVYIETQIMQSLRMEESITISDNIRISHVQKGASASTVSWRIAGQRRHERPLRELLAKWSRLGRIGNLTLSTVRSQTENGNFHTDPPAVIQSIEIHPGGSVRVGDDFTLTCLTNGADLVVNWYKDGYLINTTVTTSNKWTRIEEISSVQTSHMLGVERASPLDAGRFTCQVITTSGKITADNISGEAMTQHCRSTQVDILAPPRVWIEPMSLTVRKGENFTIKCFSASETHNTLLRSKYTYSWTKNKELLPIKTDTEHYEVLYPMGSILQVSSINKSTTFSCLVQDVAVSSEQRISVHVVDDTVVRTCAGQRHAGLLWPATAPGTDTLQECPTADYVGVARRQCTVRDAGGPAWQRPDYSACTPRELIATELSLRRLTLGYHTATPTSALLNYHTYILGGVVTSPEDDQSSSSFTGGRHHHHRVDNDEPGAAAAATTVAATVTPLLPGGGGRILNLVTDVLDYIGYGGELRDSDGVAKSGRVAAADTVLDIVDSVLRQRDSLINEQQVVLLQQVVKRVALLLLVAPRRTPPFSYHRTRAAIDVTTVIGGGDKMSTAAGFHVPPPSLATSYPTWFSFKLHLAIATLHSTRAGHSSTLVVVVYRNVSQFLPQRSAIRLKDGTELEYEIFSHVAAVWLLVGHSNNITESSSAGGGGKYSMEFTHPPTTNHTRIITSAATAAEAASSSLSSATAAAGWKLFCARTDYANYGFAWETSGVCTTKYVDATTTRCVCTRSGTYAVLLAMKPQQTREEEEFPPTNKHILIILGCFTCLIIATLSSVILLIYWCLRRSCLVFLKVQCCVSIAGAMFTFIYALWDETQEDMFLSVMSFLQIFLLIAMSSQLSKLLIVYSELVQLPKMASIKQTVVLIITGAPLIAVFGNHLAHLSMNRRLQSWWLLSGSLSFNIFVTCCITISSLYFAVYYIVLRKVAAIHVKHDKTSEALQMRVKLLRRSAFVFYSITATIFSSILYINSTLNACYQYIFCSICILLGTVILFCYVLYSEAPIWQQLIGRLKDRNLEKPSPDATSNHLKFFIKPDVENESTPYFCSKTASTTTAETHFIHESICRQKLAEIGPTTFKTYTSAHHFPTDMQLHPTSSPGQSIAGDHHLLHHQISYQVHPSAQTILVNSAPDIHCQHPDVLAVEKFAPQSDLVASSQVLSGQEKTYSNITASVPVISITPASKQERSERLRQDGEEKTLHHQTTNNEEVKSSSTCSDRLDAVLDSITHDLDYLLNDNEYECGESEVTDAASSSGTANGGTIRRISRPPSISVFEQIKEEPEEDSSKLSELPITNVLRTNC